MRKNIRNLTPPEGFHYQAQVLLPDEEQELVARIRELPLKEFEFHGYTGKRRVISFGWHRDKAVFGDVVGISLLSPCVFRLRRKTGSAWERYSLIAEPRSAYLLRGASRTEWEHSIAAVDALRYSITFRSLR